MKKRYCLYGIYLNGCVEHELRYLRACGFECYTEKDGRNFTKIFMR